MRSAKISIIFALSVVAGIGAAPGSWTQLDGSTKNEGARKATDAASSQFLLGALALTSAFREIDEGRFDQAGQHGREAVDHFRRAREMFAEFLKRLERDEALQGELIEHFKQVDFDQLRGRFFEGDQQPPPVWQRVQRLAAEGGPRAIYGEAVQRTEGLERKCRTLFEPLRERGANGFEPMAAAGLMAQLGEDLQFGAYSTAAFIRVER